MNGGSACILQDDEAVGSGRIEGDFSTSLTDRGGIILEKDEQSEGVPEQESDGPGGTSRSSAVFDRCHLASDCHPEAWHEGGKTAAGGPKGGGGNGMVTGPVTVKSLKYNKEVGL